MALLRSLLWRIVPPVEVASARQHLEAFLRDMPGTPPPLRDRALQIATNPEFVVERVRCEHDTPEYVALMAVLAAATGLLESGRFHVYRGMLGLNGQGILASGLKALAALRIRGYINDTVMETHRRDLSRRIAEAG